MTQFHKAVGQEPRTSGWVLGMGVVALLSLVPQQSMAALLKTTKVEPGDTMGIVAERLNVTAQELAEANEVKANIPLIAGHKLKIPAILSDKPNRVHEVGVGDNLNRLSIEYNVSIRALSLANRMSERGYELEIGNEVIIPLEDNMSNPVWHPQCLPMPIRSGRVVVGGVVHVVQPGQTLASIADAYELTAEGVATANDLPANAILKPRQELRLNGPSEVLDVMADSCAYQAVHFVRSHNGQQVTLPLLTCAGDVVPESRRILSSLASPDPHRVPKRQLDLRLIRRLQEVTERFPGRTIELVSGYRPTQRGGHENPHSLAQALDFNVSGVSRKKIFEFIRTFDRVGAGYYPNSVFVHLDVRDETTVWVDRSGVGEAAEYSSVAVVRRSSQAS